MPRLFYLTRPQRRRLESVDPADLDIVITLSSKLRTLEDRNKYIECMSMTNNSKKTIAVRPTGSIAYHNPAFLDTETFHQDIVSGSVAAEPKYMSEWWLFTMIKPDSDKLLPLWDRKDAGFIEIEPGQTLGPFGLSAGPIRPEISREYPLPASVTRNRPPVAGDYFQVRIEVDFDVTDWKEGKLDLFLPREEVVDRECGPGYPVPWEQPVVQPY